MNRATFAAGCFWGVEEKFRVLDGVIQTSVGYMGGEVEHPTYQLVCSGETGHAEVVDLEYDPARISYQQLLERFFTLHNPTSLNRQGWDIGSQYRSTIFYYNEEQRRRATKMVAVIDASGRYDDPVVTEVVPASTFWRAEEYHQRYIQKKSQK
ncbi:peptide-methionine (S)-S-oxide reductase MsrA [Pelovirga terrestris]|uniref:Peptide methionine sulfoxide reductase MsrA n=1 Tax=Pelovirga terrestris TaxID=2771352 RepID=A0A8J6UNR0_9BACT|nr:peptide-methionine (S)-S-oxide reductase MsrA [Pelovirga terrestris]MBD1399929.1 peptide-methionine (S)-S-oxide reductase MsrA [Pelovirga terrestris]